MSEWHHSLDRAREHLLRWRAGRVDREDAEAEADRRQRWVDEQERHAEDLTPHQHALAQRAEQDRRDDWRQEQQQRRDAELDRRQRWTDDREEDAQRRYRERDDRDR